MMRILTFSLLVLALDSSFAVIQDQRFFLFQRPCTTRPMSVPNPPPPPRSSSPCCRAAYPFMTVSSVRGPTLNVKTSDLFSLSINTWPSATAGVRHPPP